MQLGLYIFSIYSTPDRRLKSHPVSQRRVIRLSARQFIRDSRRKEISIFANSKKFNHAQEFTAVHSQSTFFAVNTRLYRSSESISVCIHPIQVSYSPQYSGSINFSASIKSGSPPKDKRRAFGEI